MSARDDYPALALPSATENTNLGAQCNLALDELDELRTDAEALAAELDWRERRAGKLCYSDALHAYKMHQQERHREVSA